MLHRSFEAIFGFAAPAAEERAALDVVLAYLTRAGNTLGSRQVPAAGGDWARVPGGARPDDPALRAALRDSVETMAAFCAGLLEAAGAAPAVGARWRGD